MKRALALAGGVIVSALAALVAFFGLDMFMYTHDAGDSPTMLIPSLLGLFLAGGCLVCLPLSLALARSNHFSWWSSVAVGICSMATFLIGGQGKVEFQVVVASIGIGTAGGLAFWPFWLWAERFKVTDDVSAERLLE